MKNTKNKFLISFKNINMKNKIENSEANLELEFFSQQEKKLIQSKLATSGNRTRASRVAGENSTTEPTLLGVQLLKFKLYSMKGRIPTLAYQEDVLKKFQEFNTTCSI